ncbi:MAG: hypothetical protein CM1200mP2_27930 [Planctomycetaceae bacterium]|nr:MAG: hypothetical protein CM1200mP2_27930 [Planctomycetaceae bacterium]
MAGGAPETAVPSARKEDGWGKVQVTKSGESVTLQLEVEPGITVTTRWRPGGESSPGLALVLDLDGAMSAVKSTEYTGTLKAGWDVAVVELRATGSLAPQRGKPGVWRALDHNSSQWAMWIGPTVDHPVGFRHSSCTGWTPGKLVYKGPLPKVRAVGGGGAGPLAVFGCRDRFENR